MSSDGDALRQLADQETFAGSGDRVIGLVMFEPADVKVGMQVPVDPF